MEILDYLPLSYKSAKEQEYIAFLLDAFSVNEERAKYQFAFLAYHMLAMSFVYFNVWQIRTAKPRDFSHGLIGFGKEIEKTILDASSPFAFSKVNERTMLRFLRLIECDNEKVGKYAKLVDDRNETAHPNGNIFFSTPAAFESRIQEVLRVVSEIQAHSKPVIEQCYRDFLLQSHDEEIREYQDSSDQIREVLIHCNYLSRKDVDFCVAFDVTQLSGEPQYADILTLHEAVVTEYRGDDE